MDVLAAKPGEPRLEPSRPSPRVLTMALWLGLVTGLLEVAWLLAQKEWNHVAMIGALRLNRHYPWMIPLSHVAIFGAFGLALELVARKWPVQGRRIAVRVLGGLTVLAFLLTFRELNVVASLLLACGIAARGVPLLVRRAPTACCGMVRYSLPVLFAGLILLFVARHAQFAVAERMAATRPSPAIGSPNVLLVVMDTVRAKSLSLHGYERATTPRLEALALKGVKFEMARSTAPWTLPSHSSMFTGQWPHELFDYPEQKLDSTVPTLAGFLGQNGYATGGFVANTYYCNAGFGLSRGFDHYEDFYEITDTSPAEVLRNSGLGRNLIALAGEEMVPLPAGRKDADRINADFLKWAEGRHGRPFFAFLNYFDAHAPYLAPDHDFHHFESQPATPDELATLNNWQSRANTPATPRELELIRDAYDNCIGYIDASLGRLFDDMAKQGILDNTIVIVTSDHGEQLGEHQLFGHGRSLYNEELHVPLLIIKPDRLPSGKVVSMPVSLRDLPATVVDLLGLSNQSPFPGRSLVPICTSKVTDDPSTSPVFSEVALRDTISRNKDRPPALRGPMSSLLSTTRFGYIRNADGREEIYDLKADREEGKDLSSNPLMSTELKKMGEQVTRIKASSPQED